MNYSISALILATADRLHWLEASLDFMDAQNFPFERKIVSVFSPNLTMPQELKVKLRSRGWQIFLTKQSRARETFDVIQNLHSDYVFYNEDDILVKLPKPEDVDKILDYRPDERKCGMLSLNLGGSDHDFPKQKFGDLLDIKQNLIFEFDNYLVFKRDENKRSKWFVEFPAVFFKTDLLKRIVRPNFLNGGLEIDLTNEYFNQKLDKLYFKASLCKKNVYEVIEWYRSNFSYEMLETAKMTRLLDPNQGDAKFDLESLGKF